MMRRDIRQRGGQRHTLLTREREVQRNGTARQHGHLDKAPHTLSRWTGGAVAAAADDVGDETFCGGRSSVCMLASTLRYRAVRADLRFASLLCVTMLLSSPTPPIPTTAALSLLPRR